MERYDPTIKPVKSNADGTSITSIPMDAFHSPWTSIGKVDRIEWYFILPKARALTVTCGRCERLSPYQRHDLMRIWTYALGESSYEPKFRQAYAVMKHLGIISYERKVSIEQDMRDFFYMSVPSADMSTRPVAEDIISCAKESGVEYMVDAYFSGVPIEHIIG